MSNLQMIEALCTLCEEQSRIIRAMALRLGELGDTAPEGRDCKGGRPIPPDHRK